MCVRLALFAFQNRFSSNFNSFRKVDDDFVHVMGCVVCADVISCDFAQISNAI